MMPDLPMPVRMTRPLHSSSSCPARSNLSSSRSTSARMAAASVSNTFLASARPSIVAGATPSGSRGSATEAYPGLFGDLVDGLQAAQQRLEPVQPQGILGVALRAGRVRVDL